MVQVGEKIPEFKLDAFVDGETKAVSLSDYSKGWLVLIFYPADFSFVCPTELQEAASLYDDFQKAGAEILSISTDSVDIHRSWHEKDPRINTIRFPMLADSEGVLSKKLGVFSEKEQKSLRGTFIIDPDGILQAMEVDTNSIGRNIGETLRKLNAGIMVREHPGELCPVNWKPGMKTLTPSK